jgi:hypothetical protein
MTRAERDWKRYLETGEHRGEYPGFEHLRKVLEAFNAQHGVTSDVGSIWSLFQNDLVEPDYLDGLEAAFEDQSPQDWEAYQRMMDEEVEE